MKELYGEKILGLQLAACSLQLLLVPLGQYAFMNPFADPLYATLLVLVVTNTRVILAADSRKSTLHADGSRQQGSMDKIFRTGDCYYAVSGFSSTEDGRFSLHAVIHKLLLLYPDFSAAVKRIATTVTTELKTYLATLKNASPALFTRLCRDSNSGGEIVLVKRVEGTPTAVLFTYNFTGTSSTRVVLQSWSIDTGSIRGEKDCFWRAIGNTAFLHGRMPEQEEMAANPEGAVKRILLEGIKASPLQIGGPVNILELTGSSERWIEKSPTAPGTVI